MSQTFVHPAALPVDELLNNCEIRRGRRSGPGGQHRNKVETAIVIVHEPTGIKAEATERRSQEQNRQIAIRRLRVRLAIEHRHPRDAVATPSELWQSRCKSNRISISAAHTDFPAVLAEALDVLAAQGYNIRDASESLGCSYSQFVKLLKIEPQALVEVNTFRVTSGLKSLK